MKPRLKKPKWKKKGVESQWWQAPALSLLRLRQEGAAFLEARTGSQPEQHIGSPHTTNLYWKRKEAQRCGERTVRIQSNCNYSTHAVHRDLTRPCSVTLNQFFITLASSISCLFLLPINAADESKSSLFPFPLSTFETESHVDQSGLKLTMPFCFCLPSTGITGMCYHSQLLTTKHGSESFHFFTSPVMVCEYLCFNPKCG